MHARCDTLWQSLKLKMLLCRVVATCRSPEQATGLVELRSKHTELDIVRLDCTNEDSIADAAKQVSEKHKHLDLLLNVAGILHIPGKMSPGQSAHWT
jgi:NAD(P)-dependent dehydrogenase (short-subunit alcohol dehydrogenase family)